MTPTTPRYSLIYRLDEADIGSWIVGLISWFERIGFHGRSNKREEWAGQLCFQGVGVGVELEARHG